MRPRLIKRKLIRYESDIAILLLSLVYRAHKKPLRRYTDFKDIGLISSV